MFINATYAFFSKNIVICYYLRWSEDLIDTNDTNTKYGDSDIPQ